jgi:penicillin V acylase-like amidase (Ntn superfamily)
VSACSTFKLQKGDELVYGHNLNQGDIGVPGMIFVNKRGTFKMGRTWSELISKDGSGASSFRWISRYGSVTFNVFGKDLTDGGMNEAGLYIWEMSEDADYPKNDSLPKLDQTNWMQFVLDSYSTVEEAMRCASEVQIEGWGWHYFVGDASGDCAAIAFIDGEIVVNRGETMPVPALFNTPYDRELELLKYYEGFGGLYEPDLGDNRVPRFVKTAVMLRDHDEIQDAVDYGFEILDSLKVYDLPEWSVVFDVRRRDVYFKTRINPAIKHFSMNNIDFSNRTDVLVLNMNIDEGGDVLDQLHPYSNEEMRVFIKSFVFPILPEDFFTGGGLTFEEYLDRFSSHSDAAASEGNQFFQGTWKSNAENEEDGGEIKLDLHTQKDAVSGRIYTSKGTDEGYEIEHLQLIGDRLSFTFRTEDRRLVEARAVIEGNQMKMDLFSTEDHLGSFALIKQDR